MVIAVDVDTNAQQVASRFDNFQRQLPERGRQQAKEIAKLFAQEFRQSIRRNNLVWRGSLLRAVKVTKTGNGFSAVIDTFRRGGIDYAAWHEFADSGHWVATYKPKNMPIQRWAQEKIGMDYPPYLFVTPTPFAQSATRIAFRKMRRQLERGNEIQELISETFGVT